MLEDLSLVVYQADILLLALKKPALTLEVVEVCQDNVHSKRTISTAGLHVLKADPC